MSPIVPELAKTRQVIALEKQAHGRTADVDRPLTHEAMADDTAALMRHLGIDDADVFGYSMGGATALQLAIRHPHRVRKLVVASAGYASDSMHPQAHVPPGSGLLDRTDWLLTLIPPFLDAPMPD
jgi:pimeloyl-ACP methyl ester carboxylesterase